MVHENFISLFPSSRPAHVVGATHHTDESRDQNFENIFILLKRIHYAFAINLLGGNLAEILGDPRTGKKIALHFRD